MDARRIAIEKYKKRKKFPTHTLLINKKEHSPIHSLYQLNKTTPEVTVIFQPDLDIESVKDLLHKKYEVLTGHNSREFVEHLLAIDDDNHAYTFEFITKILHNPHLQATYREEDIKNIVQCLGEEYLSPCILKKFNIDEKSEKEVSKKSVDTPLTKNSLFVNETSQDEKRRLNKHKIDTDLYQAVYCPKGKPHLW